MKKLTLLASSLLLATSVATSFAAPAQLSPQTKLAPSSTASPANLKLANKVWSTIHFKAMEQKLITQMNLLMQKTLMRQHPNLPAKLATQMADLNTKTIHQIFVSPQFKSTVVKAYATVFTQDQLQALYKFDSSPEGQAVIQKLPQLNQVIAKTVLAQMMQAMPALMKQQAELMKQAGITKTAPQVKPAG